MKKKLPVVAVVGRPNVGKSTFFNRVIGGRVAIVDDTPGVTRDRNFALADWAGRSFYIVDTGGVIEGSDEPMDRAVRTQALVAVEEADVIAFMVDGQAGIHPLDERLAGLLRGRETPIVLLVNKMDNLPRSQDHHDFWALGMGEPLPVSSTSGKGSGDVLDVIVENLPEEAEEEPEPGEIRVAVIGKPNVGKSSLVNRILGEERVVVSEVPGTTRDPVDTHARYGDHHLVFVDTAGLRRQSRLSGDLEFYANLRTERVVRQADVCLSLVDATEGLALTDLKVARRAWDAGKGVILLINKWDLVEKETGTAPEYEKILRERADFLQWVPILFVSAKTGQRVQRTLDTVLQVQAERGRRIQTSEVNDVLREIVDRQPPPHHQGRPVKLRYATQVSVEPPTFLIFSNFPREVPDHYIRYIRNSFRDRWGFVGTPVRIRFKASQEKRRA